MYYEKEYFSHLNNCVNHAVKCFNLNITRLFNVNSSELLTYIISKLFYCFIHFVILLNYFYY